MNMKNPTVQEIVIQVVEDLPDEYISRIVDLLKKESRFEGSRILHRIQSTIPQVDVQEKIRLFMESWENLKDIPSPKEMALMISAVAATIDHQNKKQSIELTWTGPKTHEVNLRRTDQALIELINSSKERVIIVSFAVYKAKPIMAVLEKAANRGVEINIIVESPDASEGKIAYNTLAALGNVMKSKAKVFIWPHAKRELTPNGKYGALHAKVAIGDRNALYISSANLTDYAMNLNMEMGILVLDGELPAQAQAHFDELIAAGTLSELNFD
jgi:phosphatidylserine/phosphatidylglycerophosphate/cardiolipin synthase-like enzyme